MTSFLRNLTANSGIHDFECSSVDNRSRAVAVDGGRRCVRQLTRQSCLEPPSAAAACPAGSASLPAALAGCSASPAPLGSASEACKQSRQQSAPSCQAEGSRTITSPVSTKLKAAEQSRHQSAPS